ncbi:RING/U-box superfamily protein [Actinidia rufa]|uniref:RING/U-box superfamily protein n=1 Tax=Actinidia rufa TaxID=165716 RepID=A0A7J0F2U2_9ERIC|nr:RING/U-box superfamily protein [Actinidia rufa]
MVLTAGFLVDMNLDMSTPDTYRPPPAPIPYDVVLGRSHSTDSESLGETFNGSDFENLSTCVDGTEYDCTADNGILVSSPKKFEFEVIKSNDLKVSVTEEEDVCPTCLEGAIMMQRIQRLPRNATIIFTFHAFSSGWKEVTPAPYVIRGYQNRSTPISIDSDDEESEFGLLTEAAKSPGSIFRSS